MQGKGCALADPERFGAIGQAPTPGPSRLREGSETCRGPDAFRGEVSRSGAGTALLRQRTEDIAILAHDLLRHFHVGLEIRVLGGQPHAVRRFCQMQRISRPHPQARKHFLGQDDPGGVADLRDFEWFVDTGVITFLDRCGKRSET